MLPLLESLLLKDMAILHSGHIAKHFKCMCNSTWKVCIFSWLQIEAIFHYKLSPLLTSVLWNVMIILNEIASTNNLQFIFTLALKVTDCLIFGNTYDLLILNVAATGITTFKRYGNSPLSTYHWAFQVYV